MVAGHARGPHPYFSWQEFHPAPSALTPAMRMGLHRLVTVALVPVRQRFGRTTLNSAWRTDAYNARVGGAPNSRHLYHVHPSTPAVDFFCETMDPEDWHGYLEDLLPTTAGLGLYRSHVHVDLRPVRARWTA